MLPFLPDFQYLLFQLTFVISMIGNPPLVMLDEPSTGMDPQSKRNLWDMITESLRGQRGAILTTHSMEEADALCDRIGIIVKGELRCVGSSQHLKNKFGTGYLLEAKLNLPPGVSQEDQDAGIQKLKDEVNKLLPGASVLEAFYNRLVFAIPKERVSSLGNIFAGLEKSKLTLASSNGNISVANPLICSQNEFCGYLPIVTCLLVLTNTSWSVLSHNHQQSERREQRTISRLITDKCHFIARKLYVDAVCCIRFRMKIRENCKISSEWKFCFFCPVFSVYSLAYC